MQNFACLDWLVDRVRKEGCGFPQTIIYCRSIALCGEIFSYLLQKLGDDGFAPGAKKHNSKSRFFAMYFSDSTSERKAYITEELQKRDTHIRIVVCTTALGMGIYLPYVSHVVHYGCPRDLEDYVQEIGRAGRSGQPSQAFLYYIPMHFLGCEADIKDFIKDISMCRREKLLSYFPCVASNVLSVPAKLCCDYCLQASVSENDSDGDDGEQLETLQAVVRQPDPENISTLRDILEELQLKYNEVDSLPFNMKLLPEKLIEEIIQDVHKVSGIDYLAENFVILNPYLGLEIMIAIYESFDEDVEIPSTTVTQCRLINDSIDIFTEFHLQLLHKDTRNDSNVVEYAKAIDEAGSDSE